MTKNLFFLVAILFGIVIGCLAVTCALPQHALAYTYKVTVWTNDNGKPGKNITKSNSISMDELSKGLWFEYYFDNSTDPIWGKYFTGVGTVTNTVVYDAATSQKLDATTEKNYTCPDTNSGAPQYVWHFRLLRTFSQKQLSRLTTGIRITSTPGYDGPGYSGAVYGDVGFDKTWSLSSSDSRNDSGTGGGKGGSGTGGGTDSNGGSKGKKSGSGKGATSGAGSSAAARTAKSLKASSSDAGGESPASAAGSAGGKKSSASSDSTHSSSLLDAIGEVIPTTEKAYASEATGTDSLTQMDTSLALTGWPLAYLIVVALLIVALPFEFGRKAAASKRGREGGSRFRL